MTTKKLGVACMVFALATGFATTVFANDEVSPEECLTDCERSKGNNGWGNGSDGVNPGTSKGGTADTKENVPGVDPEKEARFGGR